MRSAIERIIRATSMIMPAIVIAGCAAAGGPSAHPAADAADSGSPVALQKRETIQIPAVNGVARAAEPIRPKKELQISSPDAAIAPAAGQSANDEARQTIEAQQADSHPSDYDVNESYNSARPRLMGFSIGDHLGDVKARFDQPLAEKLMHDGDESLLVYEYPGFMFGAGRDHAIVFIEVYSDSVNPGLNRTRVGSTADQAAAALGAPDSVNEFVMLYRGGGLVLKFDLDPDTTSIRSIKLFAEEG